MKLKLIILFCLSSYLCLSQNWFDVDNGVNNGSGISSNVIGGIDLHEFNNKLFIGGAITTIGNKTTSGVAYWNGINWIPTDPASGFLFLRAFTTYQGELFAFARYTNSDKISSIVKYDERFNEWNKVPDSKIKYFLSNGNAVSGYIRDAIAFKDELYVIGNFEFIEDKPIKNIAKWNGSTWSPFGEDDSMIPQFEKYSDLVIYNNELIVCGITDEASGIAYNKIAKWNDTEWDNLGEEFVNTESTLASILYLEVFNNELYAGGSAFKIHEDDPAYVLFKWNGSFWKGVEGFEEERFPPSQSRVHALKVFGNYLAVGLGGDGYTVLYDGRETNKIDEILHAPISDFEVFDQQLYVGGHFNSLFFNGQEDTPSGIARLGRLDSTAIEEAYCKISPNPTPGFFLLDYQLKESSGTIISIYESSGKMVRTNQFNDIGGNHLKQFDLSYLPKGMYFIRVKSKEFDEIKKLILE